MTVYYFDSLSDSLSGKHGWMSTDGSGHVKAGERPVQERKRRRFSRGKRGNAEGGTPGYSLIENVFGLASHLTLFSNCIDEIG